MDSIKEMLSKRWDTLTQPSLIAIREMLLSWKFVATDVNDVVQLLNPGSDEDRIGGLLLRWSSRGFG